jgi:mannose-6-phosphate isomerase-like protein (cupin superfamily)
MKEVAIVDLCPGLVKGVSVELPEARSVYCERYFEWEATNDLSHFAVATIGGGILRAWKHAPCFEVAETHRDQEKFYFLSGTALMMFVDYADGQPDLDTVQIVRIKKGTILTVEAGKGHFVAVAEDDAAVVALVIAPPQDAPRCVLGETVLGIQK